MFWEYTISALNVLTYWETHLVGFGYIFFLFVPTLLISIAMKKRPCTGVAFKCINYILLPVMQLIAVSIFTLVLSPIMLGMAEEASWNLPWRMVSNDFSLSIGLLACLSIVAIGLVFIPVVGRLHSFRTIILGAISLVFVQMLISYINPAIEMEITYMIPGFWFITGLAAITIVLSKVDHVVSRAISTTLRSKYAVRDGVCELLMFPVLSTLGFIPVFLYGAWLA